MKINSYILTDELKKQMAKLIGDTINNNTEYGFTLCVAEANAKALKEKDKIIKSGKTSKGNENSIETSIFEKCQEDEKSIGIFHTHQKSNRPSVSDLSLGYLMGINCIGSFNGINCFKRKEDFDPVKYVEIKSLSSIEKTTRYEYQKYKNKEISEQEYRKRYDTYKKSIDDIVNKHFRVYAVNQ